MSKKFLSDVLIECGLQVDGTTTLGTATATTVATSDNSTNIATTAWVKALGYSTTDSYISDVSLSGTNLSFTGINSAFTGLLDLSALTTELTDVETVYATVRNASGVFIAKGTPLTTVTGQTSGNISDVVPADAADPDLMPALFLADEDILEEQEGRAVAYGEITGIDTSLYPSGTTVYVAPGGGWTNVKPVGTNLIQNLGVITKQHNINGGGIVTGVGRSNDVPNIPQGYAWVGNANGVATPTLLGSLAYSSATYDNYGSWNLKTNGVQRTTVQSGGNLDIVAGTDISVSYGAGGVVTINSTATGSIDYISDVALNGSSLDFTAVGSGFAGSIDLATLDIAPIQNVLGDSQTIATSYDTGSGEIMVTAILSTSIVENGTGLVDSHTVWRHLDVNLLNIAPVQNVLGDGQSITTSYNSSTGDIMVTPIFNNVPTENSNALVSSHGIWSYIDGLADNNNYITGLSFNTGDGVLTATRQGLGDLTVDLDGRYLTSFTETDPVFAASPAGSISPEQITSWDEAASWGNHADAGYLTSYTEVDTLDAVADRGATTDRAITTGGITSTYGHFGGTGSNPQLRLYTENATTSIADTFTDTSTDKSYIYFMAGTNSNDPGYIMHETSEDSDPDERNEGVLHLVPSDDNSFGDYVSIHGTNDPDCVKIHTNGMIETSSSYQLVLRSGSGYIRVDDGLSVAAQINTDSHGDSSQWNTAYGWGDHGSVGYLTSETTTELSLASNILTYRDEAGFVTELDLSLYLDDTNLARLTSGTLDAQTGIATFTRDDSSTFTVDFSALFDDVDNYVDSVAFSTTSGILTIGRTGSLADLTVDLDGRYLATRSDIHGALYSTGGNADEYTQFGIYRNYGDNGPINGHNTILNVAQTDGNYGFQLGANTTADVDGLYYRSKNTTFGDSTWYQIASRSWVSSQSYLTSYTETDTLDTVADRGATTNQTLTVGGLVTAGEVRGSIFRDNDDTAFYVNPSGGTSAVLAGNVGIGTSGPASKVHIYQEASAPTLLTLHNHQGDITPNGTQGNFIDFQMTDGNATFIPQVRVGMLVGDTDGDQGMPSEGAGNFVVYTGEGTDSSGNGTLSEHFRITDKGRFGFGTSAPSDKLHVKGTVRVDYNNNDGTVYYTGYGVEFARGTSYLRPNVDGAYTLHIGSADDNKDWNTINLKASSSVNFRVGLNNTLSVTSAGIDVAGSINLSQSVKIDNGLGTGDPAGTVIETFDSTVYIGAFLDFTIYDENKESMRSGTLQLVFNGAQVMFNEVNTMDIGDTTPCTLTAVNNGGTVEVVFTTPDPSFHIKYHVRTL